MEVIVVILVFLGVIFVAALFLGGWIIVAIARLLARALSGGAPAASARVPPPLHRVVCPHANCRSTNDASARFCRRCGRPVDARHEGRQGPVVRRVAMW